MTPGLWFWSFALFNLAAVVGCALVAFRHVRARRLEQHRAWMRGASWLIVLFLAAYVGKVLVLGKEALASWSPAEVTVLRVHETIVLGMLVAGAWARFLGWRHGVAVPTKHRVLGRVALVASLGALLTASLILAGMFRRAGML